MSKLLSTISLVFIICLVSNVQAEDRKAAIKGPITITSETLTADNKAHQATFEKNVIARTSEMTIYSDRMVVSYKEEGGEVTRIEATGNVRLHKENRLITAQSADYFADEEKVVFTGEPRAMDGENVVTGSKMTYYIKEDRSVVEKSKVVMKGKKDR